MGNRGILHDDYRTLGLSRWKHHNWVTCTLSSKSGRARTLMAPRSYTELFFLDEPTSLAAGHRPCAECRRKDYERFVQAWMIGHALESRPSSGAIDAQLQVDRATRTRRKVTYQASDTELPDGTLMAVDKMPWLIWQGARHHWSFAGYTIAEPLSGAQVEVLTPRATVAVLRAGYVPVVHSSLVG